MDTKKTGLLIAEARREKGLTQKQLAERLHISDRTVSKWERGAGFPDVALLAPLADALELSVAGLLEGTRGESAPDYTVRAVLTLLLRQVRERTRKRITSILAGIALALLLAGAAFLFLDYSGAFLTDVALELPVGVYTGGVRTGESSVSISGKRNTVTLNRFTGRFVVACAERTGRDGVTASIDWDDPAPGYVSIRYHSYGGSWESGVLGLLYISEDMTRFALKLEDGTVLATDEYLVPLMGLEQYYPLVF